MRRNGGVPAEWVERTDTGGYVGKNADETETRVERVERREKKACERAEELRAAIRGILTKGEVPMTRKELWDCLPDDLRVNEVRFREVLEEGVDGERRKEKQPGQAGSFLYSLLLSP